MQTQTDFPSTPILLTVKAVFEPPIPRFPDDKLLCNFRGEVLVIQTGDTTTIFSLHENELPLVEVATRFISLARKQNSIFLVGGMTSQGGRFRVISSEEAVGIIGRWIFEEM